MAPRSAELVTVFLALLFDGHQVIQHRPPIIGNDADAWHCGGIVLDADCLVSGDLQAFHEGPDNFYCSGLVMEAVVGPGSLIAIGTDADNAEFAGFAFYDV